MAKNKKDKKKVNDKVKHNRSITTAMAPGGPCLAQSLPHLHCVANRMQWEGLCRTPGPCLFCSTFLAHCLSWRSPTSLLETGPGNSQHLTLDTCERLAQAIQPRASRQLTASRWRDRSCSHAVL